MPNQHAACHLVGAICFFKPQGCPGRWLMGHVKAIQPLTVEVIEPDPIWHGTVVTRRDGLIRVDPKQWPRERRMSA